MQRSEKCGRKIVFSNVQHAICSKHIKSLRTNKNVMASITDL